MLMQIGGKPESDFTEPIGMLEDCHKRILHFLGALAKVAESADEPLNKEGRRALEGSLRYFRDAAPKHTADEEESLFPRLREADVPQLKEVFSAMDSLEAEHRSADNWHAEMDKIGRRWLAANVLSREDAARFRTLAAELRKMYERHIAVEEAEVFSAARRVLPQQVKQLVGREMAKRRGIAV